MNLLYGDIMERHFAHEYYETLNHKGIIKQESQNGDNSYYMWLNNMYYNYNKWVDFASASVSTVTNPTFIEKSHIH
jgi:hypothetical protein